MIMIMIMIMIMHHWTPCFKKQFKLFKVIIIVTHYHRHGIACMSTLVMEMVEIGNMCQHWSLQVKSRLWVRSLLEIPRTDIEISSKLVTRVIFFINIIIIIIIFVIIIIYVIIIIFVIIFRFCSLSNEVCSLQVTKLPYGVNPAYLGHRTHLVTTQVK